jgi:hypothetical protein
MVLPTARRYPSPLLAHHVISPMRIGRWLLGRSRHQLASAANWLTAFDAKETLTL